MLVKFKKSFTLIEFVMVVVLVGIVCGLGFPLLIAIADSYVFQAQRAESLEGGQIALSRLIRELRDIKDPASILVADNANIEFIDSFDRQISYGLSGQNLVRTVNGTAYNLTQKVNNVLFNYYDANGAVLNAPVVAPSQTDIGSIEVFLELAANPSFNLTTRVGPRRLQY